MFESKLFRSIHNHLSHITWLYSHHVIPQSCFCIAACDKSHHMIVITSRDFAILFLYRCLQHFHTKHELRTIFHHLNFFKNDRNFLDCIFWKFFFKRNFFFLFIFCTRNRHLTMIENYIKRNDVIKCELDWVFIEKLIHYLMFTNHCCEEHR
jgi:hypothetical protein